jgi:uncharacterized protein YcbK (DUF882 family)
MDRLVGLREEWGHPIHLSSAFRCPTYNQQMSRTGRQGPHTTGRAVDILIYGAEALALLDLALAHGYTGIGIKQTGPQTQRYLHLDDLEDAPGQPRPWLWSYP